MEWAGRGVSQCGQPYDFCQKALVTGAADRRQFMQPWRPGMRTMPTCHCGSLWHILICLSTSEPWPEIISVELLTSDSTNHTQFTPWWSGGNFTLGKWHCLMSKTQNIVYLPVDNIQRGIIFITSGSDTKLKLKSSIKRCLHGWIIVVNSSPLDKMAAILQTTCPNVFSWMKIFDFQIKFHWNMFTGV